VWATPPVTDNVLEGITRRTIMQLMRDELGMEVVERPIDRTEVYLADEAFLCGTGVQIGAIGRVDFRTIGTGKIGEATTRIREIYYDIVRGRSAKYRHWCYPMYESSKNLKANKDRTTVSVK